mgnify:CR=1 FL=1
MNQVKRRKKRREEKKTRSKKEGKKKGKAARIPTARIKLFFLSSYPVALQAACMHAFFLSSFLFHLGNNVVCVCVSVFLFISS